MDELHKKVRRARRRLATEQFLGNAAWSLLAMLLIAVFAVAVPKLWALGEPGKPWQWTVTWPLAWGFGSAAVGLLIAALWTLLARRTEMEAAIEIDKRFALKERVSSTLALHERERDTEAGRALADDAVRRIGRVDVGEKFGYRFDGGPHCRSPRRWPCSCWHGWFLTRYVKRRPCKPRRLRRSSRSRNRRTT